MSVSFQFRKRDTLDFVETASTPNFLALPLFPGDSLISPVREVPPENPLSQFVERRGAIVLNGVCTSLFILPFCGATSLSRAGCVCVHGHPKKYLDGDA